MAFANDSRAAAASLAPAVSGSAAMMLASTRVSNRVQDSRPSAEGRDPGIDVGGLLDGEVPGLGGHVAGMAVSDLQCLHPRPEHREPIGQVEHVGDQPAPGIGGEPHAGGECRGGELRHQRGAVPTELDRAFPAGEFRLLGGDGVRAVLSGELGHQPQQLHPGLD